MAVQKRKGKRGVRYWIDLRLEGGQRIRRAFRTAEEAKAAYHEELARRARGETPLLVKSKRTSAEAAAKYLQTGQWSPRERERVEGMYRLYLIPRFVRASSVFEGPGSAVFEGHVIRIHEGGLVCSAVHDHAAGSSGAVWFSPLSH